MSKRIPPAAAPRNRLLARLPEAGYRRLLPLLEPVTLADDLVLYQPRGPIAYAYCPSESLLSALTVTRDGNATAVPTIGNAALGGHSGLGGKTWPLRITVQIGNGGNRIASRTLQEEAERDGPLKVLLA